jgi:EcsC protein family
MEIAQQDVLALEHAAHLLEHPGLVARLTAMLGSPIEGALKALPAPVSATVHDATQKAIGKALGVAIRTLGNDRRDGGSSDRMHKVMSGISGFTGGLFGLPALVLELPVSTTVMLRSIADIARSQGEDLAAIQTRLACVEVFAFGGRASDDDSVETGYYAVRATLAKAVSEAAQYIAERGLTSEGAPALVRLIGQIASRFGATVSEKVAAQAVPAIGAIGGATVNVLFMNHFQDMGRGHFTVRRLERIYGEDLIRNEYTKIIEKAQR